MNELSCKICEEHVPELLLEAGPVSPSMTAHLAANPSCAAELHDLRATFALMDAWTAPEPSPFFDTRLHARLREEQATASSGIWASMTGYFHQAGGRGLRTAMAGALGLALALGGGTAVTLWAHHGAAPAVASPTVDDLKIYDNNAQALDQMDMLDDGDAGATPTS